MNLETDFNIPQVNRVAFPLHSMAKFDKIDLLN